MKNISTVLNSTSNITKLLVSFNSLNTSQQKVLLSSSLLSETQKEQCIAMTTLSATNTKYTAEQLAKSTGISVETLANWGLIESTDTLTMSEIAERAASDAQAKTVLDKIITQNAEAVANGKVTASNVALASSEDSATLATGTLTTAIKANVNALWTWLTTTPTGWITILVAGIYATVKAYDAFTVSVNEQKEKMENSLSAYQDAKNELSNISTELCEQEQAMNNLLAKKKLTYVEQGQLEELQKITEELRIQKDLAEKDEGRTKKQVAEDASDLFIKQFGGHEISETAINEYQKDAKIHKDSQLVFAPNDISKSIAGYNVVNQLLDTAYDFGNKNSINDYKTLSENLKDSIFSTADQLQDLQTNIADYYNSIKDIPYNDLTKKQQEIVDSYNTISTAIALIYKYLDPNTWNTMQIDNVFTTDGLEKSKGQLIEMAKEGTLNEETILSYSKLNSILEDSNLFLTEGQSAASALCDEIYSLADSEKEVERLSSPDGNGNTKTFNSIWSSIGTSDDEQANNAALEAKEKLLELAETGKLTEKELSKSPLADYFKNAGISIEDATKKINRMKSSAGQLASMETGISSISSILGEKETNLSSEETKEIGISAGTLNAMPDDVKAQTREYKNFVKVLGSGSSSMDECRAAANELATAYVNSNNFLANLTKKEKEHYISLLQNMGVENAATVVTNAWNRQKITAATESFNLKNATDGEITELGKYVTALDDSGNSLAYYVLQQQIANNNALDTSDSIKNLKLLAEQCGISGEAIILLKSLEKDTAKLEKYTTGDGKNDANADAIISKTASRISKTKKSINKLFKKGSQNKTEVDTPENSNTSAPADTGKTKQQFDWIETRLNYISKLAGAAQKAISRMLSIKGIKHETQNAIKNVTKELNANRKASLRYSKRRDKIDLPENLKTLIQKGKIGGKKDIQNITTDEKLQSKIEQFKSLNDKVKQCDDSMQELVQSLQELTKSLANLPIEKRDKALERLDKSSNLLRAKIDNKNSAADKNMLIDSEIDNMHKDTKVNKKAAEKTQANLDSAAKSAKKTLKKDKNLKDSDRKKIRSLIDSRKPITDSLLEKVVKSGNNSLLKQLYQYNSDLDANETAQYDYDLAVEQNAKSERDAKIEQHQNIIDEFESDLDLLSAQKENATTAAQKNEIVDKELETTRQIIAQKQDIADLNGDADESSRLGEELKAAKKQAIIEKSGYIKDEYSNKLEAIDRDKSSLDARLKKNEALGLGQSRDDYNEQIELSMRRKQELENEKKSLEDYLREQIEHENIVANESDPAYKALMDSINECDTGIADCVTEQINYNKAIKDMDLKNYESLITLLERGSDVYKRYQSLAELHGSTLSDDEIYKQVGINNRIIDAAGKSNEKIEEDIKDALMKNYTDKFGFNFTEEQANKFIETLENAPDLLPDFMSFLGIEDFNDKLFPELFDNLNKYNSNLDKINQTQIENENLVDQFFDKSIRSINEYIDALKKEKDIKDRTFAIEKAQFELNKAKNNLTKKVWDGSQWVYTADTEAVQSAQEAYDNAQYEELINVLEDLIETLENSKKDVNLYDDHGNPINLSDKESLQKIINEAYKQIASSTFSLPFDIPDMETPDFSNSSGNNSMNISKIEFVLPNINDKSSASDLYQSFVSQLLNLPTYSKQYDWNK